MSETVVIILIITLVVLLLFSGLFSAAETAYSSVSKTKIEEGDKDGKRSAKLIKKHYKSFGWTLSTILISNNLVNISATVLTTFLFGKLFTDNDGLVTIISTFVMTPLVVIFGEITPKLLAKKYSWQYLTKVVYVIEFFNWLFFPLTFPLSKLTLSSRVTNTEKELKTIISIAAREGVLEKREATLAKNALDLDSTLIKSIMTKESNIISINYESSIDEAKKVFKDSGHSRIPVKKNGKFIGIVIIKDVVFKDEGDIEPYIHKVPIISKNTITSKALEELRKEKSYMGFVSPTNDSKVIIGIVTMEDIVEELVGEIYDEHDKTDDIREVGLHKFVANGSASMVDLSKLIDFAFSNIENLSIKQWLKSRINRNIKTGLVYVYDKKIIFKVISNKNGKETLIEITQK